MVKKTEKTGKSRTAKPFVERTTLLMAKIAKLGERLERHASRDSSDKLTGNFAIALQSLAESGVKFLAGKPPDWRPAGSPTSSAVRGWEVGNTCRLVKEYAFLFPGLRSDKEYTVTEVKKLGEGRGSKTFLRLNDADKTFVQGAQVEK